MTTLTEADVEQAALEWLSGLGWQALYGPDIAPDMPNAEREDYGQVVLDRRPRHRIDRLSAEATARLRRFITEMHRE